MTGHGPRGSEEKKKPSVCGHLWITGHLNPGIIVDRSFAFFWLCLHFWLFFDACLEFLQGVFSLRDSLFCNDRDLTHTRTGDSSQNRFRTLKTGFT